MTTTWTNTDGATMTTLASISGPEFDRLYPDGRAWRAAGRPDYGYRAWQEGTAAEQGLMVGKDYEAGLWAEYEYVRSWCYGTLKLDGTERPRPAAPTVLHRDTRYRLDDLAAALPEEEREAVHLDMAPCDPQIWWDEYARRYPESADHAAAVSPEQG